MRHTEQVGVHGKVEVVLIEAKIETKVKACGGGGE
jgi:hypothetical protein